MFFLKFCPSLLYSKNELCYKFIQNAFYFQFFFFV